MSRPVGPRPSHWWPRTRAGRGAALAFIGTLLLAQPPIVFGFGNRIEPLVGGFPFLYVYLLVVYVAMIGVLIWAYRRGL